MGDIKNHAYNSQIWFMGQRQTTYPIEKHCGDTQNIVAYLCDIQSRKLAPMLTPLPSITLDRQLVSMCLLKHCPYNNTFTLVKNLLNSYWKQDHVQ